MNCPKCNAPIAEGAAFCSVCGEKIDSQPQYEVSNQSNNSNDEQSFGGSDEQDVNINKKWAMLSYLVFFLPLVVGEAKKSKFAHYHGNQGFSLLIIYIALWIVQGIVTSIVLFSTGGYLGLFLGGSIAYIIANIIFTVLNILILVAGLLGVRNAYQGKMEPMPVIGKLFNFKFISEVK